MSHLPDRKRYRQVAELHCEAVDLGMKVRGPEASVSFELNHVASVILLLTADCLMGEDIIQALREEYSDAKAIEAEVLGCLQDLASAGLIEVFEARDADLVAHAMEDLLGPWAISDRALAEGNGLLAEEIYREIAARRDLTEYDYLFGGLALFRLGRTVEGVARLAAGCRAYPANTQLQENLILIGTIAGDINLIITTLGGDAGMTSRRIMDSPHFSASTRVQLYKYFLREGNTEETRVIIENAWHAADPLHSVWILSDAALQNGADEDAASIYRRLITWKPETEQEYLFVGLAYFRLRMMESAMDVLRAGRLLYPESQALVSNLVFVYGSTGSLGKLISTKPEGESIASFLSSLIDTLVRSNAPEIFAVYSKQYMSQFGRGIYRKLTRSFIAAVRRHPPDPWRRELIMFFVQYLDPDRQFARALRRALQTGRSRDDLVLEILHRLTPPFIPDARINAVRAHRKFMRNCREIGAKQEVLNDPVADLGVSFSPWHALLCLCAPRDYAAAMAAFDACSKQLWPQLDFRAPHIHARGDSASRKIRIGFVAHHGMPMMSGLMSHLDIEKFETVYLGPGKPDQSYTARSWQERGQKAVFYNDNDMRLAIDTIAAQQLDIVLSAPSQPAVFYPMMAKLAPLHVVVLEPNWTDGFPASDYYMSWRPAEPLQPGAFYRTKVAYLDHPPYWIDDRYDHDVNLTEEQRQDFLARLVGTTPDQRVYLCPSTPPKLHPRMDEIIRRLLDRDPQAVFVSLRGEFPPARNLHIRWRNRMGRRYERIRFLNTLERSDAHTLLHAVDCTIDSYPIGGMSSSFDGSILGIPTVTFPANIPFGRWLSSIYNHIGVTGLSAHSVDEYVELAVRLACDKAWRRQKSVEIRSKSRSFVESRASAAEVQQFLLSAWGRHCAGLPTANWISGQWIQ